MGNRGGSIRLATFNAGLLRLFSKSIVPWAARRSLAMPGELRQFVQDERIDALCLQEIWSHRDARWVARELKSLGYRVLRPELPRLPRWARVVGSGLLLAVRESWKIGGPRFEPFQSAASSDRFACKGIFAVEVRVAPGVGPFWLLGTHLQCVDTRGGVPRSLAELRAHRDQLSELGRCVDRLQATMDAPVVVLGDLNVGPGYIEENYSALASLSALRPAYRGTQLMELGKTWDTENPLVRWGRKAHEPSALIDHCLVRAGRRSGWAYLSGGLALSERKLCPPGFARPGIPLSDHYALRVELGHVE